jgi:Protein of unknown function (DUF2628)
MKIMSVYTVYKPPLRAADAASDPRRFVFVRDGFYFWAFLLAPLWMLWHRLWLVLVGYLVLSAAVDAAFAVLGASGLTVILVATLISLLVGLEAGTLRRIALSRRGWNNVGVVSGDDLEDAERRFFGAWLHQARPRDGAAAAAAPAATGASAPPVVGAPQAPDVIGLFPESGAGR